MLVLLIYDAVNAIIEKEDGLTPPVFVLFSGYQLDPDLTLVVYLGILFIGIP